MRNNWSRRYAADIPHGPSRAWGGEASRRAGVELIVDSTPLGVVGLVEVLRHYREIRKALNVLKARIREQSPDLLVLIDYPEFNLRLAKFARRHGVPVLFYISPQIWAWRAWRVHAIRRRVSHMAVVFPFERDFYEQHDIPVTYVGHPLLGQTQPTQSAAMVRERHALDAQRPVIGLFPGSRQSELAHLMPICVGAVKKTAGASSPPAICIGNGTGPRSRRLCPVADGPARDQVPKGASL